MTMHKALYARDDVDILYVPRKEGDRGLASIEDSVDTSIRRLEDYIEKNKEWLRWPETTQTTQESTEQ